MFLNTFSTKNRITFKQKKFTIHESVASSIADFSQILICSEMRTEDPFVIAIAPYSSPEQRMKLFQKYTRTMQIQYNLERPYILTIKDIYKDSKSKTIKILFIQQPWYINQYEVLLEAGSGGMATVYKVKRESDGQIFGLKVLKKSRQDAYEAFQRMQREGMILQNVAHKNILKVHHFFSDSKNFYLLMDFITGETAEMLLKKYPLSPKVALRILVDLANAFEYLHTQKNPIIHRDIKPANIMIDESHQVKVLDFGIAKILKDEIVPEKLDDTISMDSITIGHKVMGTPYYMAPEVIKSIDIQAQDCFENKISVQSDIYSLGRTFAEMILGRHPFHYSAHDYLTILHENCDPAIPPDLLKGHDEITQEINSLILDMIARNPSERLQSMASIKQKAKNILKKIRGQTQSLPAIKPAIKPETDTNYRIYSTQQSIWHILFYFALILIGCIFILYKFFDHLLPEWLIKIIVAFSF